MNVKILRYTLGLICGVVLILLNSSIVNNTISMVLTLFNTTLNNTISIKLLEIFSKIITMLSFIGIFITIYFVILLLKNILIYKNIE